MDDGGVLFCTRTEVYFGLNAVGVKIWEALSADPRSAGGELEDLVTTLQQAYPEVDRQLLAGDVDEFLRAMAESELVKYADGQ
jgi:hypothetical protein